MPLLELFALAITLLCNNFELLGKITSVLDGYYLLGTGPRLQVCENNYFNAGNTSANVV